MPARSSLLLDREFWQLPREERMATIAELREADRFHSLEFKHPDTGEFETQINAIRDLDGYASNFVQGGAVSDVEALTHHRRVNTLFMGLRMQDMYRWGITLAKWDPQSAALTAPGTMLPITIVECRANTTIGEANC